MHRGVSFEVSQSRNDKMLTKILSGVDVKIYAKENEIAEAIQKALTD